MHNAEASLAAQIKFKLAETEKRIGKSFKIALENNQAATLRHLRTLTQFKFDKMQNK